MLSQTPISCVSGIMTTYWFLPRIPTNTEVKAGSIPLWSSPKNISICLTEYFQHTEAKSPKHRLPRLKTTSVSNRLFWNWVWNCSWWTEAIVIVVTHVEEINLQRDVHSIHTFVRVLNTRCLGDGTIVPCLKPSTSRANNGSKAKAGTDGGEGGGGGGDVLCHNANSDSLLYETHWDRPDMTFAVDWALKANYLSI